MLVRNGCPADTIMMSIGFAVRVSVNPYSRVWHAMRLRVFVVVPHVEYLVTDFAIWRDYVPERERSPYAVRHTLRQQAPCGCGRQLEGRASYG